MRPGKQKPVVWTRDRHNISKADIDPDALKVIHRLRQQGFTAYITGATVQNLMQGIKPKDFDIVTDARPGQIKRRFSNSFLIGRRFRLAHIHFKNGKIIEVATFRRTADAVPVGEDKSDIGDRRRETYGTPCEDAFRRDISINALYYDPQSDTVIDYVGGLKDYTNKRLRIIGQPAKRLKEDPVRILRVVRHAARLGFTIDKKTEKALRACIPLLEESSKARLFEELNKDLAIKTSPVFESYLRFGMLGHLLGDLGAEYEKDEELLSRLKFILAAKDRAVAKGESFSLEELYTMIFLPWADKKFSSFEGDPHKQLFDAVQNACPMLTIPRKLRTEFIQIILLLLNMKSALKTGRFKQSWTRRPGYETASRLYYLIQEGYPGGPGRTFDVLFQKRHKKSRTSSGRRHSSRRRAPSSDSSPHPSSRPPSSGRSNKNGST